MLKRSIKIKVFAGVMCLVNSFSIIKVSAYEESCDNKQEIITSINNNIYLQDSQKLSITYFMNDYLNDNEYIDQDYILEKLNNLEIENINDENIAYGAEYRQSENKIIIYNNNYDAIYHEFMHMTVEEDNENNLGSFLNEGMTMLLTYEYFKIDDVYLNQNDPRVITIKMLCEIITPDKVLEAYTKNDWSIIKNELLNIYDNEVLVNSLYNDMIKYNTVYSNSICNMEKTNAGTIGIRNNINSKLNFYYDNCNNRNLNNDILIKEYSNKLIKGFHTNTCDIVRPYFSSTEKEMVGCPYINYMNINNEKNNDDYLYLDEEIDKNVVKKLKILYTI